MLADVSSLDEAKRFKSCSLICNIFANMEASSVPQSVMDKYASLDTLNKLSLRLLDSSDRVKLIAAATFRNIASTGSVEVNSRMLRIGVASTITSVLEQLLGAEGGGGFAAGVILPRAVYLEQLVATLCNIR